MEVVEMEHVTELIFALLSSGVKVEIIEDEEHNISHREKKTIIKIYRDEG